MHSRKTAPADLEPLARYGQTLVIVWDAEDESSDVVLLAAFACAKALSVRGSRRSGADAASMQKIDAAIAAITKQIEGFDEIRTHASTVGNAAEKIDRRARVMADHITRQTETLVEQVAALKSAD